MFLTLLNKKSNFQSCVEFHHMYQDTCLCIKMPFKQVKDSNFKIKIGLKSSFIEKKKEIRNLAS